MIFKIGDLIAFSYVSEPKQGVRDAKAMRTRTQSGETVWKKIKPEPEFHDKYPQVLILHDNWQGNVHGLNLNQYSQSEINFINLRFPSYYIRSN